MSRQEFPRAVKVAVVKRATRDGVVYCEKCGALAKRWRIDHRIADSHGGKPTLENAWLLAECCYPEKDAKDTTIAAKLKRVEAAHIGAVRPAQKIQSRGFAKSERAAKREPKPPANGLPRIAREYGVTND